MSQMGYNLAKRKMKKILLFFVTVFSISFAVNAQDASGSCKLPGTYDYVNVDYFERGNIAVSNQSGMIITQLHITVTCEETYYIHNYENYKEVTTKKHRKITLCDKNFYDIQPYQTTNLTEGVQAFKKYGKDSEYNISVSVSNPICK
jgi:hypothetical protein